jgi:hypothetical protein
MNKNIETTKQSATSTTADAAIDTVETMELDNVTGGCAHCGCGAPDPRLESLAARVPTWNG